MLRRNRFWCRFGFVGEYFIQFLIRSCRSGCFCSDSNFCHRFFLSVCGPLFCGCSGRGQDGGTRWWSFCVVSEYSLQLFLTFCTCGHCCSHSDLIFSLFMSSFLKGGPSASDRVLPPVTGRSRVRVVVSLHCTGEGKACHWHPSPDPAQSGSSLHWVRPFF